MLLVGIIIGVILGGVTFAAIMQKYMVVHRKMNGTFNAVVQAVREAVPQAVGWGFPIGDWHFYKAIAAKGFRHKNIKDMVVHFVCNARYANIVTDTNPDMGAIMPCAWAVYETMKGEVYIAKMNIALMSKMYFGVIGEMLRNVARDEKKMMAAVISKVEVSQ